MQGVGTYACTSTCTFTHMYAVCIHVHIHVHVQVISAFCSRIVYIHVHVYVDFYPVVHHSAEEAFNKCAVLNTCVHVHVYVYMYMHMYIHHYNTCMCCCSCVQICYITCTCTCIWDLCHQSSSGLQVLEEDELRKRLHNELVDLRGNIRVFCLMRLDISEDREGTQADVVVLSDRDNDGVMTVLT